MQRRLCEYSAPFGGLHKAATAIGAQYAPWLLHLLKPMIDSNYRTLTMPNDSGVEGFVQAG